jgi:uncharacterized membrane protein YdjX (TVP38/TMEM64 family)
MKKYVHYLLAVLFIGVSVLVLVWDVPLEYLKGLLSGMNAVSYVSYVLILTSAVVFMPLTVMPLIPIAAGILGPFATALLSIIGWTLGAAIAFLISRHVGRPILQERMDLHKIDRLLQGMPERTHFWFIILLRLTLPVDLVSYALGLVKNLSFSSYIAATFVGVIWFSFAFAYLGDAFFEGNIIVFVELVLASCMVFGIAWYFLRLHKSDK